MAIKASDIERVFQDGQIVVPLTGDFKDVNCYVTNIDTDGETVLARCVRVSTAYTENDGRWYDILDLQMPF